MFIEIGSQHFIHLKQFTRLIFLANEALITPIVILRKNTNQLHDILFLSHPMRISRRNHSLSHQVKLISWLQVAIKDRRCIFQSLRLIFIFLSNPPHLDWTAAAAFAGLSISDQFELQPSSPSFPPRSVYPTFLLLTCLAL